LIKEIIVNLKETIVN